VTSTEERNLAAIERWAELYNTDAERMVRECYAPDCLIDVKNGISFRGHDTFAAIEVGVERQAPRRRGAIVHDQSYLDLRVWPNPGLSRDEWAALDVVRR
jgi:hypothetical protein